MTRSPLRPPSQCPLCQRYSADHHLLCAVHPSGPPSEDCPDFAPLPGGQPILWEPVGARYDGAVIVQEAPHLSSADRLELLDTHPLFTGVCPVCDHRFDQRLPPAVHWDCPICAWIDDTV